MLLRASIWPHLADGGRSRAQENLKPKQASKQASKQACKQASKKASNRPPGIDGQRKEEKKLNLHISWAFRFDGLRLICRLGIPSRRPSRQIWAPSRQEGCGLLSTGLAYYVLTRFVYIKLIAIINKNIHISIQKSHTGTSLRGPCPKNSGHSGKM